MPDVSTVNVPLSPPETSCRKVPHYKPGLASLNLQPDNSVSQSLWSGGPGCSTKNTLFKRATSKKSEDPSKVPFYHTNLQSEPDVAYNRITTPQLTKKKQRKNPTKTVSTAVLVYRKRRWRLIVITFSFGKKPNTHWGHWFFLFSTKVLTLTKLILSVYHKRIKERHKHTRMLVLFGGTKAMIHKQKE
jgi:hypothetical protein